MRSLSSLLLASTLAMLGLVAPRTASGQVDGDAEAAREVKETLVVGRA